MSQLQIEVIGRDEFWKKAVLVEWEHRHPDLKLVAGDAGSYLIENDWLKPLSEVATECNSKIVVAPPDPSRRSWIQQFFPKRNETKA